MANCLQKIVLELMAQYNMETLEEVFLKLCMTDTSLKAAALAGRTGLLPSSISVNTTPETQTPETQSKNHSHNVHNHQPYSNGALKNGIKVILSHFFQIFNY